MKHDFGKILKKIRNWPVSPVRGVAPPPLPPPIKKTTPPASYEVLLFFLVPRVPLHYGEHQGRTKGGVGGSKRKRPRPYRRRAEYMYRDTVLRASFTLVQQFVSSTGTGTYTP